MITINEHYINVQEHEIFVKIPTNLLSHRKFTGRKEYMSPL